jgi:chromosome segregation ATPase
METRRFQKLSYSEILQKVDALVKAKDTAEAKTAQAIKLWSAEREKILASFDRLRAQAVAVGQAKSQLHARVAEVEAQLKIKEASIQELQREILSVETARHTLSGEVDRARANAQDSQRRAEEYRQQNETLKNQRDSVFAKARELEKLIEVERAGARDMKAAAERQIADSQEKSELKVREAKLELEMQLREARQQNETRARYIQRLEADSAELRQRTTEMSHALQDARTSLDRRAVETDSLTREIEAKELKIRALADDLARAQGEASDYAQRARTMEMQFLEFSTRIASLEEKGRAEISIKDQEIAALKRELQEREKDSKDRFRREDKERAVLKGEIDRLKTVFPMRELVTEKRRQVDEVARELGSLNPNHPQREAFVELMRKLEDQRDRLEGVLHAAGAQSQSPIHSETIKPA